MYKKSRYNNEIRLKYKIDCLINVFSSNIKILTLSILNKTDKIRKNATIVIENAKASPNIKKSIQVLSGMFIAVIKNSEYTPNIAYNPRNFLPPYDFGGSCPSK